MPLLTSALIPCAPIHPTKPRNTRSTPRSFTFPSSWRVTFKIDIKNFFSLGGPSHSSLKRNCKLSSSLCEKRNPPQASRFRGSSTELEAEGPRSHQLVALKVRGSPVRDATGGYRRVPSRSAGALCTSGSIGPGALCVRLIKDLHHLPTIS